MEKWTRFEELLRAQGKVAVAFSGGVDSALLVKLAVDLLGAENVLALTAVTQLQARRELDEARAIARLAGARLIEVPIDALGVPEVAANPADRCYHCKLNIFTTLKARAAAEGFPVLLDGTNASDRGDYRPGHRAVRELNVLSPFDGADITKAEIREKSHASGLPNWNAPAAACLASRIPYGTALDAETLRRVEQAEDALIGRGFLGCRVRVHGPVARIEAPAQDIVRLAGPEVREELVARFKELGFDYVSLDLTGYRMGSLNSTLTNGENIGNR